MEIKSGLGGYCCDYSCGIQHSGNAIRFASRTGMGLCAVISIGRVQSSCGYDHDQMSMSTLWEIIRLMAIGLTWYLTNNSASKAEKDARKKEIHEAIASNDIARIHACIDRMRH